MLGSRCRVVSRAALQTRGSIQRLCASRFSEMPQSIPANLHLADPKALEKPRVVAEEVPKVNWLFPTLDVPDSIEVKKFRSPGEIDESMTVKLNKKIFGVALRKDIIHEVVRYHRAKSRQPSGVTKRIGEIRGSKRKPIPQKGQGRSQVGNRRNSAWVGGQKAHGPRLRDFSFKLNRKLRAQAMMIVLAAKHREGNLLVFDNLRLEEPKTKELYNLAKAYGMDERSLFIDVEVEGNVKTACSNLPTVFTQNQRVSECLSMHF
jgi:large subunit ribosomal protein L4